MHENREFFLTNWALQTDLKPSTEAMEMKNVTAWGMRFVDVRIQTYGASAVVENGLVICHDSNKIRC